MNIIITGDTGFVGGNILRQIVQSSNLNFLGVSRRGGTEIFDNYQHIDADYSSIQFLNTLIAFKAEILIHCAWAGLPQRNLEESKLSVQQSFNLFRNFYESGGQLIIAFGSSMESTLSRFKDLKSNSLSDNEKSFAILKDRLYKLMKSLGMPFHWVRPHYLFGPKQHENSLLNSTIRNLKLEANWLKTPYAKNDYVYIKDLAKLVDRVVHGNLAVPEVFDFGSGKYTSNLDFVNTLRRYLGYEEYRLPKKKGYVNSLSDNKPWQELLPNFKITTLEDAFRDMNLKNL